MKNVNTVKRDITSAFPDAQTLVRLPPNDLREAWSALACLEEKSVKRLLPSLMLTVLEAEENGVSLSLADQVIYYLDGIESNRAPRLRDLSSKSKIFETFSIEQTDVIVRWLDWVKGMTFADAARDDIEDAMRFWKRKSEQ